MKKKMLTGILAISMLGLIFAGCGDNKEVKKIEENQVEITTEKESETVTDEEATESVAETEVVEEVTTDFLAENGLMVTPNGSMTIPLAIKGTDDEVDTPITTAVQVVESDEAGYSDTILTITIDAEAVGKSYTFNVSAFDRYTGISYESAPTSLGTNNGSMHNDVVVVDVNGTQYDCAMNADMSIDSNNIQTIVVTVHHPAEYDGVVFDFGKMTATQKIAYDAIETSGTYKITDYADVFVDGQYFFTATDK